MLEIFICEDDQGQLQFLKDCVEDYLEDVAIKKNLEMKLSLATKDPLELLDRVKGREGSGIYFLDIDLGTDINGIEVAQEIRKWDARGEIIFITTLDSMMPLTFRYKVKAMDFIIKGNLEDMEKRMVECLKVIDTQFQISAETRNFFHEANGRTIIEAYENILYFQKNKGKNKVTMYTLQGFKEFTANLREIVQKDSRLVKCNHGIVVNISNIAELRARERKIQLVDGSVIDASVRLTHAVKERLGK